MKRSGFKVPGWHHARGMPDQPTFAEPPPCICRRLARASSGHEKGIHWGKGHAGACMELGCGCLRYTPDDEATRGLLGYDGDKVKLPTAHEMKNEGATARAGGWLAYWQEQDNVYIVVPDDGKDHTFDYTDVTSYTDVVKLLRKAERGEDVVL